MKKTRISILLVVVLAFSAIPFSLFLVNVTGSVTTLPDYEPLRLGPEFRDQNLPIKYGVPVSAGLKSSDIPGDVIVKYWLSLNSTGGFYYFLPFQLRAVGIRAEVWVALDLAFPVGDPRGTPVVTDDQAEYILDEFENQIIDTNEAYFGTPDFHDGDESLLVDWGNVPPGYYEEPLGKKVILISNILDDSYYNPEYPAYIVGFYSSSFEAYYDRNVISIDCYDFDNRLGDDVARPNLYESTIAHEYQHLIHDDYHLAPESWMNEACSLFAEPLNGYELDAGQIEWFLATPDNSLTKWGDQDDINILADYGASFLWALYLTSQFGFNFMGDYVQGEVTGIEGVEALLPTGVKFTDVFHNWRLANLINAKSGPYSYSIFDFNLDDLEPINVLEAKPKKKWESASEYFGETFTKGTTLVPDGYPTGVFDLSPYGTDYFTLKNLNKLNLFAFDGQDITTYGWSYDEVWSEWYSGSEDLYNGLLVTNSHTVVDGDVLSVPSWYHIEELWDFGFIQVQVVGEDEWTSLANEYTTDIHDGAAHPDIVAELPGITGYPGGYVDLTFDLSAYIGQEVIFGFRYMTDWNTLWSGWYIVEASVNNTLTEIITPLELIPVYPEADFMVTVVERYERRCKTYYYIHEMWLKDDATEFGLSLIYATKAEDVFILVSPVNENGAVDYSFATYKLRRHLF